MAREDETPTAREPVVSPEHLLAAARERERSQSQTKFFTPVGESAQAPAPAPRHAPKPAKEPGTVPGTRPATPISKDATYGPELLSESTVQLVLDLALRIGEVQLASGAGAADATATILAVTGAYGLPHSEVDVIFSSITVSVHRGTDVNPITALRLVRTRGTNYSRLDATEKLLRKISAGKIRVYEASAELDRITRSSYVYPRWAMTLAWAAMAGSISILIGGNALVAMTTAVITAAIDRVGRFLNRRSLPMFFQQLIGGLLATFLALALVRSQLLPGLNTSLMVGAAITVLLSGLSVVSTVQDAITGYYVTAAGRTVEVALTSAGLIAGVVIGLNLAQAVGIAGKTELAATVTTIAHLPVLTVAGAAAAAFFTFASQANIRSLLVSAAAGALGAASYGTLQYFQAGPIASSGLAAVVIGFAGGVLARRLRIPPVIVAIAGLTPLLPGYSTYRALFQLAVSHDVNAGLGNLTVAVTVALALGAGVVLGEFLGQPVRHSLGRLERRFSGPRFAGPLRPVRRRID